MRKKFQHSLMNGIDWNSTAEKSDENSLKLNTHKIVRLLQFHDFISTKKIQFNQRRISLPSTNVVCLQDTSVFRMIGNYWIEVKKNWKKNVPSRWNIKRSSSYVSKSSNLIFAWSKTMSILDASRLMIRSWRRTRNYDKRREVLIIA